MKVAVIGAGAAGSFCSILIKRLHPLWDVDVFEASDRPMRKLALTGGGRCNLTNTFRNIQNLKQAYPRGDKLMKRILREFSPEDTREWFEKEGVRLTTEADQRIFPCSQNALDVVNTLLASMRKEGISLHLSYRLKKITPSPGGYELAFSNGKKSLSDKVVIVCGGMSSPKVSNQLFSLDMEIIPPVPSLFSFHIEDGRLTALAGTTIGQCTASIPGTKFRSEGSILVTHQGMSGPAILKLSSYAARYMAEMPLPLNIGINWMGRESEEDTRQWIKETIAQSPHKHISSVYPPCLTSRFWKYMLEKSNISTDIPFNALNTKQTNRLTATLTNDIYPIKGKNRNKEEFVTCGGIALSEVYPQSLESRKYPGIFFAGEILDIDAITGGFNLQAAWSTGCAVARHIASPVRSSEY